MREDRGEVVGRERAVANRGGTDAGRGRGGATEGRDREVASRDGRGAAGARARVTLAEIAARTGTSVPTVSKVINGRPDVSAATRERVQAALRSAGYESKRRGRAGRGAHGRGRVIELVMRGLDSPWASVVVDAVEQASHEMGRGVVVTAAHGRNRPPRAWVEAVTERQSDGAVLVVSELTTSQLHALDERAIPYVFVDPLGDPPPDAPVVGATNWAGGVAATEHLLELGHERIAVISGPQAVLCSRARVDGFRAALGARSLRPPRTFVRFGEFNMPAGLEQATRLLSSADPPTAIFCASDMIALGAYEAAHRLGLRVPGDVSIVGFDDLPLAAWVQPNLTTVRQPLNEMATLATRMLGRLIDGERPDALQIEVATRLVVRGSTAAPGG